jgi:Flp pilus assembly CpaF family ATPase
VTLRDLVHRGSISPDLATFLTAAVRGKKSIVVSGPQGAGKTTLLRALCACLDPWERLGTIETEHELHLFELTGQHRRVSAREARPGSGERGRYGRPAGEVTVADITYGSWRANLSRLIVGEVRGVEVLSMFEAMQGGAGSMSTTHANSGRAAVERLVTLSVKSNAPVEFAYRQVAEHIDLVVHVDVTVEDRNGNPNKQRYVSEVVAVGPGENGRPAYTDVFTPGPDGHATPGTLPEELRSLTRFGLDPTIFDGGMPNQPPAAELLTDGRWNR